MRKLKTLLATIVAMVGATLSLTMLTSAASVNTADVDTDPGYTYYTETVKSGNIETYSNEFDERKKYATFNIDASTSAITGNGSYTGNFKYATVILRTATKSDSKYREGNATTVKTEKASLGDDKAIGGTFIGTINNGTGSQSEILNGYLIYVNKS